MVPRPAKVALSRSLEAVGSWTSGMRILPTFQVVGAQRSGTSSLYEYLVNHPLVGRSSVEEVHFFDSHFLRGLDWYQGHFPTRARAALTERRHGRAMIGGEATPYYMAHPLAIPRLAQTLPSSRLIVVLRDPVDRAYSHYQHEVALGAETLSFAEALDREDERLAGEVEAFLLQDLDPGRVLGQHRSGRGVDVVAALRDAEHDRGDRQEGERHVAHSAAAGDPDAGEILVFEL